MFDIPDISNLSFIYTLFTVISDSEQSVIIINLTISHMLCLLTDFNELHINN